MQNESLQTIFRNPVFLSAFFSWFLAQLLKALIDLFRPKTGKGVLENLLWSTGGMPSSHSSMVTGLTVALGFKEGFESSLFFTMLFVGMIVIRDAMGVRRSSGLQARYLNKIGQDLKEKLDIEYKPLKEVHGHTVAEVSVGVILGLFVGLVFSIQ
jgi:acid phosphatase family membrane protein YuiD